MPLQASRGRCEQSCQQHDGETQTASPNGAAGGGSGPHFLIMSQRWRPAGAPGSSRTVPRLSTWLPGGFRPPPAAPTVDRRGIAETGPDALGY
ncbi:MAG: hypothetical protein JWN05_1898 [Arthrobacter sp.]|nr:hypothetical protein [Arthrobacter sp.]